MSTRLFSQDDVLGVTTQFHYDESDGSFTLEAQQDVTGLVEDAKAVFNSFDERARWSGDMNHVASIPLCILAQLKEKGITRDEKAMKAWLNSPDNRAFRTRPGRI